MKKLIKELLETCFDKNEEGGFHVFYDYSGHVQSISIRVTKADTDYQGAYYYVFSFSLYIIDDNAEEKLQSAIDKVRAL